jgi:BASS family bile acid:Na+ symporter
MTLAQAIPVLISLSIFLMVTTLGLNAEWRDAASLFRKPGLLLRSVLAMNVIMVVFAAAMVSLFDLSFATKVAIIAIAMSPVPPLLPKKQVKSGGDGCYADHRIAWPLFQSASSGAGHEAAADCADLRHRSFAAWHVHPP